MAVEKEQAHRAGCLKQANKPHKHGRHRSKGQIDAASKGKVSLKSITKKRKLELSKETRKHQALQIRRNKRDEVLAKKRSLGGFECSPFLVCILPLNREINTETVLSMLTKCDPEAIVTISPAGITHLTLVRFKQRFAFVMPSVDNELEILDALKMANRVLFLVSASKDLHFNSEHIDTFGNKLLYSVFGQGLPTPIVAVTDLDSVAPKKRHEQKQVIQKLISKWLPDEKIIALEKDSDALNILRRFGTQKSKSILYRDRRPHMVADHVDYIKSDDDKGTLKVTGYLRGTSLSVNSLVHVLGMGTFQMAQIDSVSDPYLVSKQKTNSDEKIDIIRILECEDPKLQESLQSENVLNPLDAEQTWPTEEDVLMAKKEQAMVKKIKKVPKGWSEYQSAWIPDVDSEVTFEFSEDEDNLNSSIEAVSDENSEHSDMECQSEVTVTESEIGENDQKYDNRLDFNEEQSELEKIKSAQSHVMFPDEIDTPQDVPARVRFQKYRGLRSFRTSPWDPMESLPYDYGRIFRFENYDRTRKHILQQQKETQGVQQGWFITVHLKDVSEHLWNVYKSLRSPVMLMGLLPQENKMSVMNVVLTRTNLSNEPIKSKERLIFQCGPRRFIVNPIFSQHTNGNKHKFERFFQPNTTAVATFFAPILFPPAPVLCFKEINNNLILVATGNVLSCNPDRIILKRVVLSGYPLKIHKRSAVIRFMFFNREDIDYYKVCELRTKMGRCGNIKQALGTHGHMKCQFNHQLQSQDTVLLNLYKRVFPKWTFEECLIHHNDSVNME